MSLAKDIANMLFDCETHEEVVMRVTFRCGVDIRKTPIPRGLALSILAVIEDKVSKMFTWNSIYDPEGLCNLISSLDGVTQKTKMLEKLSHDDKVRFVYDVAHAMHRAGEPRSGIELVVLLTRWLKVESNDFLDFARTQPKSHVFEHFLDRYPQPSLDAFRSRKTK